MKKKIKKLQCIVCDKKSLSKDFNKKLKVCRWGLCCDNIHVCGGVLKEIIAQEECIGTNCSDIDVTAVLSICQKCKELKLSIEY